MQIKTMLNQKMREISVQLLKDEQHMPSVLRMEKLNKYTFNTPNDGGTGAQYRGVITFDLANMELSPGGNELFGRAWNKETEIKEDGE